MYRSVLIIHILAGATALACGLLAILSRKGKRPHTLSGTWFYLAMYLVGYSAVVLSLMQWNPFLLSVGIFSSYLTYSGKQAIGYWRLREQYTPMLSEKLPVALAFFTSLAMILYPLYDMMANQQAYIPVSIVFGAIMLSGTIRDFMRFSNPDNFTPRNANWLLRHIAMMGGAYISAITAFLVVNLKDVPFWMPWLLPTVIGSALITITIRKWKRKLDKTPATASAAKL